MPKGKAKPLTLKQRLERLESRFPNGGGLDVDQLSVFNTKQQNRIAALEEAICPRVAARLTALERHVELQKGENQAVFQRLNTDDADKRKVFEVLNALRGVIVARVEALEKSDKAGADLLWQYQQRITQTEKDISAINKSVAILSSAIQDKPGVMVEDTPELRRAFGVKTAPAPSKREDRAIVSYLITAIKKEMGLEFTEQGMKRIIELIEKV